MSKGLYYKWQGNNLLLDLYVQPKSSKNTITGKHGERLKITITAPPVAGKANSYLMKFLAKYFGIPQTQVKIIKGGNSKYKSVILIEPKNNLVEFQK